YLAGALGDAAAARAPLDVAAAAASAQVDARASELARLHAALRQTVGRLGLNQLTASMVREAQRRAIPWIRLASGSEFVQFGHGRHARYAHETVTDTTSALGAHLARDKAAANALLARVGLPTADSRLCDSEQELVDAAQTIGFPVVVKQRDGSKGRNVFVRLTDVEQVRDAWARLNAAGVSQALAERFIEGDDHRLLVIAGRLVAAARRLPASVVGDGSATIRDLVAQLNLDPRRGRGFERLMEVVDLDHEAERMLAGQGLSADSVAPAGERVVLRGTANVARGGHAEEVTDTIHPENRELAERAAVLIGLDVAAIDLQSVDITRSWRENGAALIEINSNPGLRPHWIASPDRDVVAPLFERIFAPGAPSRVPTIVVAASDAGATSCPVLARILSAAGHTPGLSSSAGAFVGAETLAQGDCADGRSAQRLLCDRRVDSAVFEIGEQALVKSGMFIEDCDVALIARVRPEQDARGAAQHGAWHPQAAAAVARMARVAVVLDAADPGCAQLGSRLAGEVGARRLVWVGEDEASPALAAHLAGGGEAVVCAERGGAGVVRLLRGPEVEAELALASGATANALHSGAPPLPFAFAAAAAWALRVAPRFIAAGLSEPDPARAGAPER
ncbi:MAG: acetate--CoA ligase family protein, partial [Burkholderiaceae bacterium]|nr:acetate--CoA ligase family protein [Burkholderiaceae bacterium]